MLRLLAFVGLFAVTLCPAPAQAARAAEPAAEQLRVEVLARYPHDPEAFTQGLELRNGLLYEGTGLTGRSDVRTVQPTTGQVRQRVALPDTVFGEGITIVGDRVWQLTFTNEFAFERDLRTLAELRRVPYSGQGWGLCSQAGHRPESQRLVMSNGSAELTFRDPSTFEPLGSVTVTLDGQPLSSLNELECVGDRVWANVWPTDSIVRIDPSTGVVDAVVDAAGLLTPEEAAAADVLNGIAAVPCTNHLLLTGKLWPWTFLIRFG